jgi:hypothetical protein
VASEASFGKAGEIEVTPNVTTSRYVQNEVFLSVIVSKPNESGHTGPQVGINVHPSQGDQDLKVRMRGCNDMRDWERPG